MVLILTLVFFLGSGVFAQTEAGKDFIGEKETWTEGQDNTLLIEADFDNFEMDFKIEAITIDEKYYYVKYTCLDLILKDDAWVYQLNEKTRKVSKKFRGDLGEYMAEELREEYDARIKVLQEEQANALQQGESVRTEVVEYSGLIGQTLDLAAKVFPDYKPTSKTTLVSPENMSQLASDRTKAVILDDLSEVYNDYIERNDPDGDDVFGALDNCPEIYNPEQADKDYDGIGDLCDEYFDLKPAEEDLYVNMDQSGISTTSLGVATTSVDDIIDGTTATSTPATSTSEILNVEIIDLYDLDDETATGTED